MICEEYLFVFIFDKCVWDIKMECCFSILLMVEIEEVKYVCEFLMLCLVRICVYVVFII